MISQLGSKNLRNSILRWIGTITALVLLVFLFRQQGWYEIREAFQQITWQRFCLCLVLIFVSRLAVVGRWHSLLRAVENIPVAQSLRLTFAGLFATNFLPTTVGGDVIRLAGAKQLKIDLVISAASLVVDRLIGMLGMALALPLGARSLFSWIKATSLVRPGVHLGVYPVIVATMFRKVGDLVRDFYQAFLVWSKQPTSLLLSFGFTVVHMLCFFGVITLLLDGLGEPLSLGLVGGLWSFVYFVTLFPISINGYGVQEVSMAFIFNQVGGISLQSSLAASVLFRTLIMLGSVPGVFFVPGIFAGAKADENTH